VTKQQERDALAKVEEQAAFHVQHGIHGIETDLQIAEAITDDLIAAALLQRPTIRLAIFHDARKRGNEYSEHKGPCPLPYDWKFKNAVGIKTKDREVARDWCMKALLLGYAVFQCWLPTGCGGGGMGTVAEHRKRLRERRAFDASRAA
jgi:hypothetical protein